MEPRKPPFFRLKFRTQGATLFTLRAPLLSHDPSFCEKNRVTGIKKTELRELGLDAFVLVLK
jgi:hypothetical protein